MEKNLKSESVRDEQQRHDQCGKKECSTQLSCRKSGVIGLIEGIEDIGRTPEVSDPRDSDTGWGEEQRKREQCKGGRNDVSISGGVGEGGRQIRRDHSGDDECQANEAEAVEDEQRPQSLSSWQRAEFWRDVLSGDNSPHDEAVGDIPR